MAQLSKAKQFSLDTLEVFDELARPEIQNKVMSKIWDYLKGYTKRKIMEKPDEELRAKLLKIHETTGRMFKDLDLSVEINESEKLGSPKIPNVGHLGQVKALTSASAEELIKELQL